MDIPPSGGWRFGGLFGMCTAENGGKLLKKDLELLFQGLFNVIFAEMDHNDRIYRQVRLIGMDTAENGAKPLKKT